MRGLALSVLVPAAFWALRPSPPLAQPGLTLDAPPVAPESAPDRFLAPLDPKVFTARLWNPKPPPAAPASPPAGPAQPTKPAVTLVAVIERPGGRSGGGQLQAALYDPAQQRVRVLDVGQSLGQYTIATITTDLVILSEGPWSHELRLREERPPSPLTRLIDVPKPKSLGVPGPRIRVEP